MQFIYWNEARKGTSQTEIALKHKISRQAVSKSIQRQRQLVLREMLRIASAIGSLVEWQDDEKGTLIGVIPQLDNLACIILTNAQAEHKVFYEDRSDKSQKYKNLLHQLRENLALDLPQDLSFQDIISHITGRL